MPDAKSTLLICLGVVGVGFVIFFTRALLATSRSGATRVRPTPYEYLVGFVTDFFDTLGIGSFATTTAFYRARATIDDRLLPGTLNVGHTLPTIVQAFIYITVIDIDVTTLIAMIVAAVLGSLVGAPIVSRWPRRKIQLGLGIALLILCAFLIRRQFTVQGGSALALHGANLYIGVGANFVLGALMTIGVGLYAPCLVLVSLLGLNADTGFPIMMGSCAFLMPLASVPFIKRQSYSPSAALGLTLSGVPAVLIAAFLVKSLPLYWVKWLVAVVVIYTGITLLQAALRTNPAAATDPKTS